MPPIARACSWIFLTCAVLVLDGALAASAGAAIAPWFPREGVDDCRVVAGAPPAPTLSQDPPSWFARNLTRPMAGPGGPRHYTVPPLLNCRGTRETRPGTWACEPSFVAWAKTNCKGMNVVD